MQRWRPELRAAIALAIAATGCGVAAAEIPTPWPNADFGMSESELRSALPALQRAHSPGRGPRGERGLWTLPDAPVAGLRFSTMFYFKGGKLQRIEQLHDGEEAVCGAAGATTGLAGWLTAMRERYGTETGASDPLYGGLSRQAAAWVSGDTDVTADWASTPARCTVHVVFKPRVLKNGSEL